MAVTDPDARPHQRASMLIVDADTPGVNIVRDIPTMEHPAEHFGRYGGHAEIVYDDVRVPADALLGGEGEGFLIAQHRLGPGRIHHCMRWLGVSRRAFDMLCERAVSRYAFGSVLAEKQTIQNWVADSLAEMQRRAADDAARGVEDGQRGRVGRAHRDLADQVLRRRTCCTTSSTARSRFMGHLGTRPTYPWRRCTATRAPPASTTGPTRSTASPSPAACCAATSRTSVPSEHVPTRREAARERFADLLEAVTSND